MSILKRRSTLDADLSAGFDGQVIGPADALYDEARPVYNAMIDRRPALLARCRTVTDVAKAVSFGRDKDLEIAVRGGGHNGAGFGTVDNGLVIDLSALDQVQVDPAARRATVGGGALLSDLDRETHKFGLATPAGIISTTGVGGLTLGGGHGYLTRKHGLTIDNLIAAEVVLADGRVVTASERTNEDLFWALRGGGGNLGVVTSFTFALHPVSTIIGGPTLWPLEAAGDVLSWYQDFQPNAPEDLSGFFAFITVPPVPPFPEELHLRKMCAIVWCYTGPPERAENAFAPALTAAEPALHGVHEMPYPMLQQAFDGLYPAGHQWYWRGDFLREVPEAAIDRHLEFAQRLPTMQSTMHIYPIDGAAHRVGEHETAFAHRDANFSMVIAGVDPDPANADAIRSWTVDYWDAIHPYSLGGAYVNFMMDEGPDRVRATYGDNYERLTYVKAKYDPHNLFHINQNIPVAR
ncbi:MAG: FAD-binding oxidoreductase [Solirubrobacterales bacterium]|nr:FAD-binding oxidoreductase [Solirubrobacterales bacterium]